MAPTILYVNFRPDAGIDKLRLAGLRRFAAGRAWRVETLDHAVCSPESLRGALRRLRPVGCAAEAWDPHTALRPSLFGHVPVVYFSLPPNRAGWGRASMVECDNALVARMAFKELSSTKPSSYAVLSCWKSERWAVERIAAFRECCREAGADCQVAYFGAGGSAMCPARARAMVPWAASLPRRCAIFAVNDCCAHCAAKALAAAGRHSPWTATLVGADGVEPPPKDRSLAATVSTVRLDFEFAGYLAAKMLGSLFATKDTKNRKGFVNSVSFVAKKQVDSFTFPPLLVDRHKSTRGYGRRDPRILEAMETIRREACDGLTAAALAARYEGSRRLFEIRFREAAGHSILDEILNVRMARAVDLLANTEMRIDAIANFCGFNAELAFWKAFRKRMGVSPLEFRKTRR